MADHDAGYVHAISGIVDELIAAYEKQQPVNMTRLKNDVSKRYKLPSMPKVPRSTFSCHFNFALV